jgi:hypothetical protein
MRVEAAAIGKPRTVEANNAATRVEVAAIGKRPIELNHVRAQAGQGVVPPMDRAAAAERGRLPLVADAAADSAAVVDRARVHRARVAAPAAVVAVDGAVADAAAAESL